MKSSNENPIFYIEENDSMEAAYKMAQDTFKYFWRELSWEYRRIIPGLNFAMVKIPFSQELENGEIITEHMWINNIDFDGKTIRGVLVNDPHELTNIKNGDEVTKNLEEISDWLFSLDNKTYGGFTIHLIRSQMSDDERQEHDDAWGLDFGDFNDILVVIDQKEKPENLVEHPMSINMKEKMLEFLQQNPNEISFADDNGLTLLHRETIAGNQTIVETLLELGADKSAKSKEGKTPLDYAKQMNWEHLIPLLE